MVVMDNRIRIMANLYLHRLSTINKQSTLPYKEGTLKERKELER